LFQRTANGRNQRRAKSSADKSHLTILEGILLEAYDNFKMTGNDLELGIECLIDADILEKGSIVLNSKMFGDIVRRLPDSEVLIEVKENIQLSLNVTTLTLS